MSELTQNQKRVLAKVYRTTMLGQQYRAESNGERVTLASLFRNGFLQRRAWRGKEGEADAAHEYQIRPDLMEPSK